eukprot:TRINITY_DN61906_c0_g1_i1.p1 TRINITY_DN61906_c0_g1~~TRINITY_DN61906_c0_g1_i1.p1  ORF type:complete len:477 (+),score=46.63 TRINITY_DN61906_c0_g1_i1:43-1473(+)
MCSLRHMLRFTFPFSIVLLKCSFLSVAKADFRLWAQPGEAEDVTLQASRVDLESHAVGYGPTCYGVWTQQWTRTHHSIPEAITRELSNSDPEMLKRIMQHECPYGRDLPGQVTWPAPMNMLKFVAVMYSYVPYVLTLRAIIFAVSEICSERRGEGSMGKVGTTQLNVLLWLIMAISVQELILKPLIVQPRPGTMMQVKDYEGNYVGSCLSSCGMPSSHSMLATGWFMTLVLERIGHVVHFRASHASETCSNLLDNLRMSFDPWIYTDLRQDQFATQMAIWFLLLMPVPWMRVLLYDHSTQQAFFGSCMGILTAVMWWRMVRRVLRRHEGNNTNPIGVSTTCWARFDNRFILHDLETYYAKVFRDRGVAEDSEDANARHKLTGWWQITDAVKKNPPAFEITRDPGPNFNVFQVLGYPDVNASAGTAKPTTTPMELRAVPMQQSRVQIEFQGKIGEWIADYPDTISFQGGALIWRKVR